MKQFWISLRAFVIFSILTGIIYPLAITTFAQIVFPAQANGSVITENSKTIGSEFIGQNFTNPKYFHGRPSAGSYDASNSGGSNFALTNQKLIYQVQQRIDAIRKENNLAPSTPIPADLVFASASGLDPHISVESAALQVQRIAKARGLSEEAVNKAIEENTQSPFLGIFGAPIVNVLTLNITLDTLKP